MNRIYLVIGADKKILASFDWKDAKGSSLSQEHHDKMQKGHIICVDKSPCKVKFFRKDVTGIKSICFSGDCSISIVKKVFGNAAFLKELESKLQPVSY